MGIFDLALFEPLDLDTLLPSSSHDQRTDLLNNEHHSSHESLHFCPGDRCLEDFMLQSDPLRNTHQFRFEMFHYRPESPHLIDTNGDGIADVTCWGTPVEFIEAYHRQDGTHVRAHYRTVADDCVYNNLSR